MEGEQEKGQWCAENVWRIKSKSQGINEIVWDTNKGNELRTCRFWYRFSPRNVRFLQKTKHANT